MKEFRMAIFLNPSGMLLFFSVPERAQFYYLATAGLPET
jgi:hypothetical protein